MEENFKEASVPAKGLNNIWLKYYPYWPVFVVFAAAAIVIAWFYLQYQVPKYSATTTILIKDKEKGNNDSKVVTELNPLASNNNIENEIELLKSQTMMREVVKNLNFYAPVFEEGRFVPKSAYTISPIIIIAQTPDAITPVDKAYFNFSRATSRVEIDGKSFPLNYWVRTAYGTLKFVPNPGYVYTNGSGRLYFSLIRPNDLAAGLVARLDIGFVSKGSTVVYVSTQDEVEEKAKDLINELVSVYNHSAISDQTKLAANTLSFIEERLKYVMDDLNSIEQKVQQYKASKGAVDINQQGQLYLSNVSVNDQRLGELNTQLGVLDQVENYVTSKDNGGAILPSSMGLTNSAMSELLTKLHDAELQYASLKGTTGRNNPVLSNITEQINLIKPALLENIRNQRRSLEINRNTIMASNGSYTAMLQKIPQKERELIDISREQNIKNTIYTFLLQKREETGLSYASTVPEIKIVDKALSYPSAGNTSSKKIYIIAFLLGFITSVAFVYLKELFNQTVTSRSEIESFTSWPIIGEIPYEKLRNREQVLKDTQTRIFQQFRKLRASLNFLGINSKRKKILITSFISGEGKSFITANLGVSLALTGKRVVLLEFDLNNPTLREKFQIRGDKGITDYLLSDVNVNDLIISIKDHENLFMIPSGPLRNNPSEIIMNGKFQSLLRELDSMFDYILIDTAPIGPTPDAYTLSAFCDASLFVVRHNYTPKSLVKRIDEETKINPIKNAAIIFNGVRSRGFTKNASEFGYGYSYIYDQKKNVNKTKGLVVRRRN